MKKLFTLFLFALLAITSAWAQDFSKTFSQTYSHGDFTGWSLSYYSDEGSYYLVPASGTTSDAVISGIFANKTITSAVTVTLNVATYGEGTNPSASTFALYADAAATTAVTATKSGNLPTSKTYTDVTYTIAKGDASSLTKDLMIRITKPGKQIRLKSITVEFTYEAEAKPVSSLTLSGEPTKKEYYTNEAFSTAGLTVTANYTDGTNADVTSQSTFECNPATFTTEGSQNVAVTATYNGKTATENYTVTVTAPSVSTNTYTLVTSTDELVSGAEYVLLTNKGDYAASSFDTNKITTVTSNNNFTLENNIVTVLSENVNVFTFKGDNTNGWTITDKDGVVYKSVDDNNLSSGTATVHTISFNNNVVAISAKGISTRKWMFNSTGSMIRNYKSGTGLYLYKSNGPVVNKPAKPTFSTTDDATTFTESLKVTITPAEGCKVKYQLGEAEAVTATDTNPVEVTLTETTTITAWSVNDENVESDSNSATYTKVEPFESKTFTLVTSTENIVDGEYVLVSADGTKAASVLGSELTTVAVGDNTFSLSDDGVVTTLGETVNVFTFAKNGEGKFTITDKDGKKLESSSTANSIKATTNGGTFDISINSKGNVVISGYTNYLWKHNTSADYIRNYKTTSTTDVQFLKLYKAGEVVVKPAVPTFDPVSGTTFTTESATVTITAAEGCTLKYTLGDGVEETAGNSTKVTVTPTAYTIKAKSVNAEGVESVEATATYKFNVVAHVKNIAEFMALEPNATAIFDNPVVVLYDYSQPQYDKNNNLDYICEYIWVKDESGQTNIYLPEAFNVTTPVAQYENGDVIPAGFTATKNLYDKGNFYQALVDATNKATLQVATLKHLADPVTITFGEFKGLTITDDDLAEWNNTYVMIPRVNFSKKSEKQYTVSQDGTPATSSVFYNKYSDEGALKKDGKTSAVVEMRDDGATVEYNVYGILQVYNNIWEIMPIRFVEYSAQTVTLKELVEAGNAGTTTEGTEYTILNDLRGVVALPGNVILAKDENGNAVGKVTPAGKSFMINAKSKFDDAATEESVNATAQEDYDQSNWVEIVLPEGVSAANYVDHIITGMTVKGNYTDTKNPRLEASAAPAAGGATGAYTRNAMCPANFMGTSQKCNAEQNHGDFFFMTPKPNECVQVVWAVYNSEDGAFYIPAQAGSINSHGFKGAFSIDWAYNADGKITNLTDGNLYQFAAVVKKIEPGPRSPKRKVAYVNNQPLSSDYVVFPLNLDANYVTGITETTGAKTVKSVRYFNIMGVELAEPTAGVNIVLTTYTDGTTHSQKILK